MTRKVSKRPSSAQFELDFEAAPLSAPTIERAAPTLAAPAAPSPQTTLPSVVELPPAPPEILGPCIIYTDGGCEPNPGRGGWAAIVIGANGAEMEMCGTVEDSTNNRMEIWAALQALQSLPPGITATVHTDSQYVQKGATEWLKGWKRRGWVNSAKQPVANQDLWQLVDLAISQRKVTWKWVRGHADNVYNNRCDVLANASAKGKKPPLKPLHQAVA